MSEPKAGIMATLGTFGVIYADPPWQYQNFADSAHGAAKFHYDTMPLDELLALRPAIDSLAAKDCVLLLWGTFPKLDQAFLVMKAWGFEHVTGLPWIKTVPNSGTIRTGVGFWMQSCSELLLIARRGKPKADRLPILALLAGDERTFHDKHGLGVFCDKIGGHSAKPLGVAEWIEHKCDGPYLELFATKPRAGWTSVGRGLGTEITPQGVRPYTAPETREVRGEQRKTSKTHG